MLRYHARHVTLSHSSHLANCVTYQARDANETVSVLVVVLTVLSSSYLLPARGSLATGPHSGQPQQRSVMSLEGL